MKNKNICQRKNKFNPIMFTLCKHIFKNIFLITAVCTGFTCTVLKKTFTNFFLSSFLLIFILSFLLRSFEKQEKKKITVCCVARKHCFKMHLFLPVNFSLCKSHNRTKKAGNKTHIPKKGA